MNTPTERATTIGHVTLAIEAAKKSLKTAKEGGPSAVVRRDLVDASVAIAAALELLGFQPSLDDALAGDTPAADEQPAATDLVCRMCGCTEEAACEGGCRWVEPDLCSACVPVAGDEGEDDGDEDLDELGAAPERRLLAAGAPE